MKETDCSIHKLVADVAVIAEGRVLLVKYRELDKYDHQKGWFIPDDLLRHVEHPDRGARRVLHEQVGLVPEDLKLNHMESFIGEDGTWHLIFHYVWNADKIPKVAPSKDLEAAEWFPLDALPPHGDVAHEGWAHQVLSRIIKEK